MSTLYTVLNTRILKVVSKNKIKFDPVGNFCHTWLEAAHIDLFAKILEFYRHTVFASDISVICYYFSFLF